MVLAVRKPQPSDPNTGITAHSNLDMVCDASFSKIHYIFAESDLSLKETCNTLKTSLIAPSEANLNLSDTLAHFYLKQISGSANFEIDLDQNFTEQLGEIDDGSGTPGNDGEDGKSAYEIAVDNGFIGTEEEWLDSLVGAGVPLQMSNLEQDLALYTTNPAYYKEFFYSGEDLTGYAIYTDNTKAVMIFNIVFVFNGDELSAKTVTRISDNRILTVNFGYTDGELISQTRTIS